VGTEDVLRIVGTEDVLGMAGREDALGMVGRQDVLGMVGRAGSAEIAARASLSSGLSPRGDICSWFTVPVVGTEFAWEMGSAADRKAGSGADPVVDDDRLKEGAVREVEEAKGGDTR
jgi:hypothetical protein